MITLTEDATRAIHALCAAGSHTPSVRVRTIGAGRPLPVGVTADTDHRPGDLVAASDGVVVLVDHELAAAVDDHTLDARPSDDDQEAPRFYFTTSQP
jgi:Fe-S cluster assembly iron-binding protein IscA